MVSAVNAIAAAGYLMRPRLVREVRSPEGVVLIGFEPEPVRRVVSRETAARIRDILTAVVERGTGTHAAIPGYRVAGKTGTAQKAQPGGGYSKTDFVASFVGFVPAERPELTALVVLDSPEGNHTGGLAAGVFADMVEPSLHYLGIPPQTGHEINPVLARWPELPTKADTYDIEPRRPAVTPAIVGSGVPKGGLRMPALYGLSARDAVHRIVDAGLVPELFGSGWVIGQDPLAGTSLVSGSKCTLILGARDAQRSGETTRIVERRQDRTRPNEPADESVVVAAGSS
jgi:cell division protein FtsI (penicillin-binding protein 3)